MIFNFNKGPKKPPHPDNVIKQIVQKQSAGQRASTDDIEALTDSMGAHHRMLFAEKVQEHGGRWGETIRLNTDGRINEYEHKKQLLEEDPLYREKYGDLAGRSLVQFLHDVVPVSEWVSRRGIYTIDELKKAAELVSKTVPQLKFSFNEDGQSVTYTVEIEGGNLQLH